MSFIKKLRILLKLDLPKFIYYNFIAGNVKRDKDCWVLPYRGTCIDIAKSARIELHGNLSLNTNKLRGSKAECFLLLRDGSKLTVNKNMSLYYNATVLIFQNAHLTVGRLGMNCGSTISCERKITMSGHVRMARLSYVFDSDRHPIYDKNGKRMNEPKEVIIEDNVWLGLKTTVLKGTHIHAGTVISANSLVSGNIPGGVIVTTMPARPVMKVDYNGNRPN